MSNVLRFIDPKILASISGMELRAKTVVEGFLSGLHKSPYKGFSVEFAEYRQYTPGDDPRHIDWKVFGRFDRYYVKEFEEETNLNCHIVLDLSNSMNFASNGMTKLEYASYLAASLAYLISRQRDGIGLVTFGDKIVHHIPAQVRSGHLQTILLELSNLKTVPRTDIGLPLHQVADAVNKKGMIVLISDLLDDPEKIIHAIQHFRFRGHEVIVFNIFDAAEITFPYHNTIKFVGLEGEGEYTAIPHSVRDEYLARLKNHIAFLEKGCGSNRTSFSLLDTSKPLDFALQAYLAARAGKM
ncbi:MAG: DUF58 domain-containing protein [Deferribacteres bacterium]|nr:DUF58 domain-containing protein [candidate division KSB1 bacterium]MCB9501422.1 DUF58 domain-containing protein [Deferribacteres bacterium]